MKKFVSDASITEAFTKVNPFFLCQPNTNSYMVFVAPKDAYYYVLTQLIRNCPRGFIELLYIMGKLYPEKMLYARRKMCEVMMKVNVPDVALIDYDSKEGRNYLEQFFNGLHTIFGTKFNQEAFNAAYQYSKHLIEVIKVDKECL